MITTTLTADFVLANEHDTYLNLYSEHCWFVDKKHLESTFGAFDGEILINDKPQQVTEFFHFSLESIESASTGALVQALTTEFRCLLTFDGWWDIYVPIQFLKELKIESSFNTLAL